MYTAYSQIRAILSEGPVGKRTKRCRKSARFATSARAQTHEQDQRHDSRHCTLRSDHRDRAGVRTALGARTFVQIGELLADPATGQVGRNKTDPGPRSWRPEAVINRRDSFAQPNLIDSHVHITFQKGPSASLDAIKKTSADSALDGVCMPGGPRKRDSRRLPIWTAIRMQRSRCAMRCHQDRFDRRDVGTSPVRTRTCALRHEGTLRSVWLGWEWCADSLHVCGAPADCRPAAFTGKENSA